jgi:O-antigen ligase
MLLCLALLLALFNLIIGVSHNPFAALFDFRSRIVFVLFLGVIFARWGTLRPLEYLAFPLVAASMALVLLYGIRLVDPLAFVDPNTTGAMQVQWLEGRVINAETVTFLGAAAAFFLCQGSRNRSNGFRRLAYWALAGICLVVVLMSRQRTATTGVIVGLSALFLLHPTMFGVKRAPRLLAAVLIGALVATAVTAGDVLEVLPDEYRESLAKRDTLNERFEIWTEALAAYSRSDFSWQLFGRPTGVPLVLQLEAGEWRYSVHSAYVGLLMSDGIVGSFLWHTLLLAALFAALRPRHVLEKFDLDPALAVCWLAIFLIYGYSYEWKNGAWVFIGMAMIPLIRYNDVYVGEDATRRWDAPGDYVYRAPESDGA